MSEDTAAELAAVAEEAPAQPGKGIAAAGLESTDNVNMINTFSYLRSIWIWKALVISLLIGLRKWLLRWLGRVRAGRGNLSVCSWTGRIPLRRRRPSLTWLVWRLRRPLLRWNRRRGPLGRWLRRIHWRLGVIAPLLLILRSLMWILVLWLLRSRIWRIRRWILC